MRFPHILMRKALMFFFFLIGGFVLFCSTPLTVYAQIGQPQLVQDINPRTGNAYPGKFTPFNGMLYFAAENETYGNELWKTDGTAGGTELVADLTPGKNGSEVGNLVVVDGALFFTTHSYVNGYTLWKSDGIAAGTLQLRTFSDSTGTNDRMSGFVVLGHQLYFTFTGDGYHGELWRSDGTISGTVLFKKFILSWIAQMVVINNLLFFEGDDFQQGHGLWKSDGTEAGTVLIKDVMPTGDYSLDKFIVNGNTLLFFVESSTTLQLWQSDGTTAGTTMIKDLGRYYFAMTDQPVLAGNTLYFIILNPLTGGGDKQLWKSNGTTVGTVKVKDLRYAHNLTAMGTLVYFVNSTVQQGRELWRSDGTFFGTKLVKDINPGAAPAISDFLQDYFVAWNNQLYFFANNGVTGQELWKSDGTDAGTTLVKDLNPGVVDSLEGGRRHTMTIFNNHLYFDADGDNQGSELWASDGTAAGTGVVKDINASKTDDAYPAEFYWDNGVFYFTAANLQTGQELWKSDSTGANAILLKDIYPGPTTSAVSNLVKLGNRWFFSANDGVHGQELWVTDGTNAGTVLVKDICPGSTGSSLELLTVYKDELYLSAGDCAHGQELWKSDGTTSGTILLKDINPNGTSNPSSYPDFLYIVDGLLYFSVASSDGFTGDVLWQTDGTPQGTQRALRLQSLDYYRATKANGVPYFLAGGEHFLMGLWRVNGTPQGTTLVKEVPENSTNLRSFNGALYFVEHPSPAANKVNLWKSDGTTAGTLILKEIPGYRLAEFTSIGKLFYFVSYAGMGHDQLWRSDGSVEGTYPLKDLVASGLTPYEHKLTYLRGKLFFVADFDNVPYLWQSDGTIDGTLPITNVGRQFVDPASEYASVAHPWFTLGGDNLYYPHNDGVTGLELWSLNIGPAQPTASDDSFITAEDQVLTVSAPGLLGNDTTGLTMPTILQAPQYGLVTIHIDGSLVYTPVANFNGGDFFTYSVQDGKGGISEAAVSIYVTPVNDPPIAADDMVTGTDQANITISVLANDYDLDGDGLKLIAVMPSTHGFVFIVDNNIVYSPAPGFQGDDTFFYTTSDAAISIQAQVTIHVQSSTNINLADADGDGLLDTVECPGNTNCPDTDGDNHPNAQDSDSDGDGIPDLTENQPAPLSASATLTVPPDSDGDQLPDYLDLDSDNDGISDAIEGHDANHDGQADVTPTDQDSDGDGLDNAYDTVVAPAAGNAAGSNTTLSDSDSDHLLNWRDNDDDGDGILTKTEGSGDANQNGIPDYLEAPTTTPSLKLFLPNVRR